MHEIHNRPKKIYAVGNIEILRKRCVAIVGCRKCSVYSAKATEKIAYNLAKNNIIIVSGLAIGVDSYAHKGAIRANGRTIAVVAHGLDMIYPQINRELAIQIVKTGGAIISEYPIKTPISKEKFPLRNRIISGISEATIVTEAKDKSGSLITATYAIEQGRDLYALPGSIYNENSYGTNKLIKEGAIPIIQEDDVESIIKT